MESKNRVRESVIKVVLILISIVFLNQQSYCQISISDNGTFLDKKKKPYTGDYYVSPLWSNIFKKNNGNTTINNGNSWNLLNADKGASRISLKLDIANGTLNKGWIDGNQHNYIAKSSSDRAWLLMYPSENTILAYGLTKYVRSGNSLTSECEVFKSYDNYQQQQLQLHPYSSWNVELHNNENQSSESIVREYNGDKLNIKKHYFKNISTREENGAYVITFYSYDESSNDRTAINERKYYKKRELVKREVFEDGTLQESYYFTHGKLDSVIQQKNKNVNLNWHIENGVVKKIDSRLLLTKSMVERVNYSFGQYREESEIQEYLNKNKVIHGTYYFKNGQLRSLVQKLQNDTIINLNLNKNGCLHKELKVQSNFDNVRAEFNNGSYAGDITYERRFSSTIYHKIPVDGNGILNGIEKIIELDYNSGEFPVGETEITWKNGKRVLNKRRIKKNGDPKNVWGQFTIMCYDEEGYVIECD